MRARTAEPTIAVVGMDSADSLPGLAPVYGRVLALRDAGLSDEAIAVALGVTVEAIPALIDVAARKRERTGTTPMRDDEPTGARDTGEVGE